MTPIPATALELAKAIKQDPANIRKKAAKLNGQVNFDREADTFTPEQLRAFLPEYLTGQRQLTGEKRRLVESLLTVLGGQSKEVVKAETEPSKPIVKGQSKPVQGAIKSQSTSVKTTQSNPVIKWLSLVVAVSAVFWQASHFAHLEAMDSSFVGTWKDVVSWGIAIGFESLALLLTVFSDKGSRLTWAWLIGFGVVALFMNLSFYGVIDEPKFRQIILSIALPFSIIATTHLFISNNQRK
jgi:hypothetical protein